MLFIYEVRIKRGHAKVYCLSSLLPRQPSACPSWTCFLCILVVANENIMHLKLTSARARGLSFPLRTHLSLSLSLCLLCSALFSDRLKGAALSVKHRCCFSNFTCNYSQNHSYCLYLMCSLFDFIRRRHDYKSGYLCRLTSWKGELVM